MLAADAAPHRGIYQPLLTAPPAGPHTLNRLKWPDHYAADLRHIQRSALLTALQESTVSSWPELHDCAAAVLLLHYQCCLSSLPICLSLSGGVVVVVALSIHLSACLPACLPAYAACCVNYTRQVLHAKFNLLGKMVLFSLCVRNPCHLQVCRQGQACGGAQPRLVGGTSPGDAGAASSSPAGLPRAPALTAAVQECGVLLVQG